MLVLPGGFSHGDDLGAGKLWAAMLSSALRDGLERFIEAGRPVLGICNGFQVLVKAGLLPGPVATQPQDTRLWKQSVTLDRNDSARFECRWVRLGPQASCRSPFLADLRAPISCPAAHGEGKFVARDEALLEALEAGGQVALRYLGGDGDGAAKGRYPENPNGSMGDVAGICNEAGNVLGLMPHPENHVISAQHPRAHRGEGGELGLPLFEGGMRYAARCWEEVGR